ncbi:MAG TPA: flavin reductase family protein [Burkholderiales bacterium]|nr:flavin reductase family protein [Burkholderiales bacterium]
MTDDIAEFFQHLNGAAYVIGVAHEGRHDIFAAASVMLASRRPPSFAVSIDRRHASYPLLRAGRVFSISVMRKSRPEIAHRFGAGIGRPLRVPDGVAWHFGRAGAPVPDEGVLASFECEMTAMMAAGDHQIMLGKIVNSHIVEAAGARVGASQESLGARTGRNERARLEASGAS